MKKKICILVVILAAACLISVAQSVWNPCHLERVREQADRPMYARALAALIAEADTLLDSKPLSVMMKTGKAPCGDPHYYVSLARYYHPDPDSPDGLPYINIDGVTNPEISDWDRTRLGEMSADVITLSLAWYFSGDERYASKATDFLTTWFIDPATRMYPNFEYAQMIPGVNGNRGRCYGVLDGYSFVEMLDAVALLASSESWTLQYDRELKKWMDAMLDWMLTSDQGKEEGRQANNHATAYDAQVIALAMYTGREEIARKVIGQIPEKRIFTQIAPDGRQPYEMWRTLSFGYSQYNLTHFIDIFMMAEKLEVKIDDISGPQGESFYKALDYLASYIGKDVGEWPGEQISGWNDKCQDLLKDLWRVATMIDTTRTDYRSIYLDHRIFNPSDRFTLLYYTPDEIDDAFVNASVALEHAAARVDCERQDARNAAARKVSPRSVDGTGRMTLVHPHDWTSGFFAGELWMMYEFTRDPYWRKLADAHTWPIEEAKSHGGTHDLGFMIGDSFGKGWRLTGEKNYFDVMAEASATLCTRFNPVVGAIRSWDHNADEWKFPVIIDNMMNLEMLFEMSAATGDPSFRDIAVSHADVTLANHFRPDYSSCHVVDYDPFTGKPRMKVTAQGYADDSYWSRGQSWGVYGYTMCYRFTSDKRYLRHATGIADWFLSLENMPEDKIPYWDMKAPGTEVPDNPDVPRDASAAAVLASALYELAEYVDDKKGEYYISEADEILRNLTEKYTIRPGDGEGFILGHSTGHLPAGSEIDVPLVYADYYYLEALLRKRRAKNVRSHELP